MTDIIHTTDHTSKKRKKGKLHEDIEEMMFGFGDTEWPPNFEAVTIMEQLVINYIEELTTRAIQVSELTGKLDKECFLYLVRKQRQKFTRVTKLLKLIYYI